MANEFVTRRGLISLGGITFPYVRKTSTYTVLETDYFIDCFGTFTVILPTSVDVSGKIYVIKNTGSGIITIDTTGSQTIDGVLTKTLTQNQSITIQSNGSNWLIVVDGGSSFVPTVENGLGLSGSVIGLGGTISRDTLINVDSYDFKIENFDTLSLTGSVVDIQLSKETGSLFLVDVGDSGTIDLYGGDIGIFATGGIDISTTNDITFTFTSSNITDISGASYGLVYDDDYSLGFVTNSLVSKKYVDSKIFSGPGAVNGSGTTNYVPRWLQPGTLSSTGSIYDSGSKVGIGITNSNFVLSVNGTSSVLNVLGSGSNIMSIDGSGGRLLDVGDSIDYHLLVNDDSGENVLKVSTDEDGNSGSSIYIGGDTTWNPKSLYTTREIRNISTTTQSVYTFSQSWTSAYIDYLVGSGSNVRSGMMSVVFSGGSFATSSPLESSIGSTNDFKLGFTSSGTYSQLVSWSDGAPFDLKVIIRSL